MTLTQKQQETVAKIKQVAPLLDLDASWAIAVAMVESSLGMTQLSPTGCRGVFQMSMIAMKDLWQEMQKIDDDMGDILCGMLFLSLLLKRWGTIEAATAHFCDPKDRPFYIDRVKKYMQDFTNAPPKPPPDPITPSGKTLGELIQNQPAPAWIPQQSGKNIEVIPKEGWVSLRVWLVYKLIAKRLTEKIVFMVLGPKRGETLPHSLNHLADGLRQDIKYFADPVNTLLFCRLFHEAFPECRITVTVEKKNSIGAAALDYVLGDPVGHKDHIDVYAGDEINLEAVI